LGDSALNEETEIDEVIWRRNSEKSVKNFANPHDAINGRTAANVDDSTVSRAELRNAEPFVISKRNPAKRVNNFSNALKRLKGGRRLHSFDSFKNLSWSETHLVRAIGGRAISVKGID
jgi:hypothetical protein